MNRQQNSVQQKVLSFIRENRLLKSGDKVVAAVSGGPDSVCLLYILAGRQKELGISLHLAHLNHQLRGAESDADAAYVKALARKLKIPATIESADVKAYQKKNRLTLEEAAREVRYRFLAAVMQKSGAGMVAVGHTANDHIETVLMHLIRGTGIKGLRGLLPESTQNIESTKIKIIRPLLGLKREETEAYCRENRLEPRTDATNLSTEPFRNKVRRQLLPELKKYNPQIAEALIRTARSAADDIDFIESGGKRIFNTAAVRDKGTVTLDKKGFLVLHPALQRQVLRQAIESLLGSLKDIEAGHIEDMMDALNKPAGKVIALPFGLNFFIEYDRYIIAAEDADTCPLPELNGEIRLTLPGITFHSGWMIEASLVTPEADDAEGGYTACFDAAATGQDLVVRACRPGDSFRPLGMKGEKKINRFMIDEKIPRTWRPRVPVICCGDNIIWVAGYRIDDRYRVKPGTKKVLKLGLKGPGKITGNR